MVSTDCMRTVVNAILADRYRPAGRQHNSSFAGVALHDRDAAAQIAARLYAMNQQAIRQRYPDTHSEGGYDEIPDYHPGGYPPRPVAAHKAITCLLYQCSEGNVVQSPLYRELLTLRDTLANQIVADMPEWEKAPWG